MVAYRSPLDIGLWPNRSNILLLAQPNVLCLLVIISILPICRWQLLISLKTVGRRHVSRGPHRVCCVAFPISVAPYNHRESTLLLWRHISDAGHRPSSTDAGAKISLGPIVVVVVGCWNCRDGRKRRQIIPAKPEAERVLIDSGAGQWVRIDRQRRIHPRGWEHRLWLWVARRKRLQG